MTVGDYLRAKLDNREYGRLLDRLARQTKKEKKHGRSRKG